MEIKVKVPDELASQAQSRGVPVEAYVEELLAERARVAPAEEYVQGPLVPGSRLRTPEQIRAWLDSLTQFSDKIPPLPQTISREWIYQDHD